MIRVGFVMAYSDGWMGGVNYFSNLVHAARSVPGRRIDPVLVMLPDVPQKVLAEFPDAEVIRTSLIAGDSNWRRVRSAGLRLLGRDLAMERFLRSKGIELLSHSGHLGPRASLPTIGWVADFQHKHLPQFFDAADAARRDASIRAMADNCTRMVLSSAHAQGDLAAFAPDAAPRSRVLHFISGFGGAKDEPDAAALRTKYQFDGPYIHLPGQFWAHKNHRVVVDALALLKARGRPALVLATGHTNDYRNPQFFGELMAHVERAGVQDSFRVLGVVPYADLAGLMRNSAAVINPSLFEGWSTTVEESKSLGKRLLLSDIPVHREQAPERGIYFDAKDAESLAQALERVVAEYSPAEEQAAQARARDALPQRFVDFGRRYEAIVLDALGRR